MNAYQKLQIPAACAVDKPIFKKMFHDNVDLSKADKALFTDVIDKMTWVYCLKTDSIHIPPYRDEVREYPEIEMLEVSLSTEKGLRRIAEIIMRAIPYPMLLIFRLEDQAQVWAAHQRFNLSDSEKVTLEDFVSTQWQGQDSQLWDALALPKMRFTNFYALYSDWVDAISIYNAQSIVQNGEPLSGERARQLITKHEEIEKRVAALRVELKKETQFNRKMEISMEIKRLERGTCV